MLVLRDNAHEEIPIPLSSIKVQKEVGSLMPTGLADTLTHGEFLDLIRFLAELGKPGPYGPSTAQYVRRWRSADRFGLLRKSAISSLQFHLWKVASGRRPTAWFQESCPLMP